MWTKEFIYFVISGGIAALANILSRKLLSSWLPFWAAVVIAYIIGMATAFILFKHFVFSVKKNSGLVREITAFILVNALALIQTLGLSIWLDSWLLPKIGILWHKDDLAHLAGVALPVFTSYFCHKYYTFKKSKKS